MLAQRVNRTDAEKIFMVVHNVDGTTLTTGFGARFVGGIETEAVGTSADGASVVMYTAGINNQINFAGVANQDIVADGYGLVQVYGYCDSIAMSAKADVTIGVDAAEIATGTILLPGAVAGTFFSGLQDADTNGSIADILMVQKFVRLWDTVNISGGVPYGPGFVRAL
jgi:hypothetical protein